MGVQRRATRLETKGKVADFNISKVSLEFDIKQFVKDHFELFTSGRAIARIFHGLHSPKYPSSEWYLVLILGTGIFFGVNSVFITLKGLPEWLAKLSLNTKRKI